MADVRLDEFELTKARLVELRLNPVEGKFDSAHLREIHRRLTQDLPEHRPGQLRPDEGGGTWIKARELSTGLRYEVPYQRADQIPEALRNTLERRDLVGELRGLDKKAFAGTMAKIYGDLDYAHPFVEANSRTLREFTAQLARAAGHDLQWSKMADSKDGRDLLYLARDASVWSRAYPGIDQPGFVPADRRQHEAEMVMRHAGRAFPTLATAIEKVHEHRPERSAPPLERGRGVDR